MSEAAGLSSASGGHILEPMPLVSVGFLEQGEDGPAEVLPLSRGEILRAGLIQLADRLIKFVIHSFLTGSTDTVLDVVSVVPLIPGQVVKANKQAFDPSLGRLPAPQGIVMALLDLAPLLGQEAFKEVLPANEGLGLGCLPDVGFCEVIARGEAAAPPGQVLEKGLLKVRVGFGLRKIGRELRHAFSPHLTGALG